VIKYIGSKRRLVPVIAAMAEAVGGESALDLFTGTTRVAQAFKALGLDTTAVDSARYSEVFSRCYIESDARQVDRLALEEAIAYLSALPGQPGYFTETFCVRSRFVQPFNGERVDAIRRALDAELAGSPLRPILLTSLIEAVDRVDSTTGVQMAYVKQWAPRSYRPLDLRAPTLLEGKGRAQRGDACELAASFGPVDVAYVDPPYNQHRYFTNYHIWETLVAWDAPEHYGTACKRIDCRDPTTKSVFNTKREMPGALRQVVRDLQCRVLVLSYNDEGWVSEEELADMCAHHEVVRILAFDSRRYVGAQIGIHSPAGVKVGTVSHLRNTEYLVVAGSRADVGRAVAAVS
jgi:adenine-specific DNA-methyltransferase